MNIELRSAAPAGTEFQTVEEPLFFTLLAAASFMYLSAAKGLILRSSASWRNTKRLRFERLASARMIPASAVIISPLMPEFSGFRR